MLKPTELVRGATLLIGAIVLLPGCVPVEDAADAVTRDLVPPPVAGAQEVPPAPAAPATRVLLQRTFTVDEIVGAGGGEIGRSLAQFAPNEAGSKITVRISGNATGSRLVLVVRDGSSDLVVLDREPVTNATVGEFISTTTAEHSILVQERGQPSALYTLTVTEE
jgi:hypothetical protein